MDDRKHDNLNAKIRATIDDAIADLLLCGMESRDDAASLMAVQAIVRIDSIEARRSIVRFAESMIPDDKDEDD